jgi:hypothetical protein
MVAKAATGTSTKDAMAWAENEMKKVIGPKLTSPEAAALRT